MAKTSLDEQLKRLQAKKDLRDKQATYKKQIVDARKALEALRKKK
jgi:hypothetical protein